MASSVGKIGLHIHHDTLFEVFTDPISVRRRFIREHKPAHEVRTRLRLMRVVPEELLPARLRKALAACDKAWAAHRKALAAHRKAWAAYEKAWAARAACGKAGVAYEKAGVACAPQLEALHKRICPDCPWDGKTIFPKEE